MGLGLGGIDLSAFVLRVSHAKILQINRKDQMSSGPRLSPAKAELLQAAPQAITKIGLGGKVSRTASPEIGPQGVSVKLRVLFRTGFQVAADPVDRVDFA